MRTRVIVLCALGSIVTGCVSAGRYDRAVSDAEKARAALAAARTDNQRLAKNLGNEQALGRDKAQMAAQGIEAARAEALSCQKALDDATAVNQELHAELARLGKDADQLLVTKGVLSSSLEQAKLRLEELRRAQAAAEARSQLFRDLALKLKRMVDAGELQILLRSGRMVLVLPNDVLFDSGKAAVKPRGKETLGQIAAALATIQKRRFQVAGHTDNDPIRYSGFRSNWELSAQRALEVTSYLIETGMHPDSLSAAGYGEFDPVAGNDSAQGKAKNRRIEITLQPNIDELVAVPGSRG